MSLVAGCDCAYDDRFAYAAWVVLRMPDLEAVATATARTPILDEYRPGFFARRELAPLLAAFENLKTRPDLVICDAAGIAHPARCGLACELGRNLGLPTIGCTRNPLFGDFRLPGPNRGDRAPITHGKEFLGWVLRTRPGVRPVFVSPGWRVPVENSWQPVLACAGRYRTPEPLRLAHAASVELRRRASVP